VVSLLGEGGFAKVFRGGWGGVVGAVRGGADDATNDKLVMKNAHEIAILAALSHPNIIQVRASAGA
jgi:serine/threonine protein kinase